MLRGKYVAVFLLIFAGNQVLTYARRHDFNFSSLLTNISSKLASASSPQIPVVDEAAASVRPAKHDLFGFYPGMTVKDFVELVKANPMHCPKVETMWGAYQCEGSDDAIYPSTGDSKDHVEEIKYVHNNRTLEAETAGAKEIVHLFNVDMTYNKSTGRFEAMLDGGYLLTIDEACCDLVVRLIKHSHKSGLPGNL